MGKYFLWSIIKLMLAIALYAPTASVCHKEVRLQDNLCSDTLSEPFSTLRLTEDHGSGAFITQTWNMTLPSGGLLDNKIKYDCQFRVETNERPSRGINTIITHLKFRSDPVTKKCIDYIQFTSGNRAPSERICSDISIEGPAGRFFVNQQDRDVHVHIFIDRDRHIFGELLELGMVMTAYSECQSDDFLCKDHHSCISRHFVRDNIPNCMYSFHDATAPEVID